MTPEYWQKLKEIFNKALEIENAEREAYLDEVCGDNRRLRKKVKSLLNAHHNPGVMDQSHEKLMNSVFSYQPSGERKGEKVGPYEILETLGHGGMGSVYLAERADGQFDQKVALKLLRTGFSSETQTKRFLNERQILAALNHKNIARLFDGGITGDG